MTATRKLSVVHIITKGRPMGGAQWNTYYSLLYQRSRYGVELITGNEGPLNRACVQSGIDQRVIVFENRLVEPISDVVALGRLWRHLRDRKPDIVHTHSSKAGILGRVAAWLAAVPVVVHTVHVLPYHDRQPRLVRQLLVGLERACATLTDTIVPVADSLGEDLVRKRVCTPDKLRTVVSGIDLEAFYATGDEVRSRTRQELGILPSDFVVVSVANLEPRKRLDVLVEAAAQVLQREPQAVFLVVGEGEMREAIDRHITALGIGDRFHLCGHRDDVPAILAASDVYVQTSQLEGLSRSLIEAMYSGLAVVATDVNATHEVVREGVTGLLVPAGDARNVADRVLTLLGDEELRQQMGCAGRKLVGRTRSIDAMGRGLDEVYAEAWARRRSRGGSPDARPAQAGG